ncbi:hypothetical protein [Alitabrizicola rongguiensis]|uniref:hypothetical protein n=1 Tax=Alitabrizicola rongguiensis TaxID=2909234 RepID=UPI001F3CA084|nr:hypothetical protein [Tabrizicola rongguiensis]
MSNQAKYLFSAYPALGSLDGLPLSGLTTQTMKSRLDYALSQLKQRLSAPGRSADWVDAAFAGALNSSDMLASAKTQDIKEKAAQLLLKALKDGVAQIGSNNVKTSDWEDLRQLLDAIRLSVVHNLEVESAVPEARNFSQSLWALARVTSSKDLMTVPDMKSEWDKAMDEAGVDRRDPNAEVAIIARKVATDISSVEYGLTKLEGNAQQVFHLSEAITALVARGNALRATDSALLAVLGPRLDAILATAYARASKVYTARAKQPTQKPPSGNITIGIRPASPRRLDDWDDWSLIDPDKPDVMKPAETEHPSTGETGVEK